jgi:hypothetical protein
MLGVTIFVIFKRYTQIVYNGISDQPKLSKSNVTLRAFSDVFTEKGAR